MTRILLTKRHFLEMILIGHNKFDHDYVLGQLQPDVVHSYTCGTDMDFWASLRRQNRTFHLSNIPANYPASHLDLALNPIFLADYASNAVYIPWSGIST